MAVNESTIDKTSGDYSTISAWEADTDLNGGADVWKGLITDAVNYDENFTIDTPGTGVGSHVWLTVDEGARHDGTIGTGARVAINSTVTAAITVDQADWAYISWLEIGRLSGNTGTSDECIRVEPEITDALFSYLILWTDAGAADTDGIYLNDVAGTTNSLAIDNCIAFGFSRAAFNFQYWSSSGAGSSLTAYVEHCCGFGVAWSTVEESGGVVHMMTNDTGDDCTIYLYNNWGAPAGGDSAGRLFASGGTSGADTSPPGVVTWNGSHNGSADGTDELEDTDNTSDWQSFSSGIDDETKGSGSWVLVTDISDPDDPNLLPIEDDGNLLLGNGTNRQGSEPDARQDFSVAVNGARGTTDIDIGPFQISGAGGTPGTGAAPAIARSFTLPAATAVAPGVGAGPLVARDITLPQPTARGGGVAAAPTVTAVVDLPAPSVVGGAVLAAPLIAADVVLPLASGKSFGSADAPVIARSFTLPQTSVVGPAVMAAPVIDTPASLPAASVAGPGVVSADVIARDFVIPLAAVAGAAVAAAPVIARSFTLPSASVVGPAVMAPPVIAGDFVIPVASFAVGGTPGTGLGPLIAAAFAMPTADGRGAAVMVVPVIAAVAELPAAVFVSGGTVIEAPVIAGVFSLPAASVVGPAVMDAPVIAIVFAVRTAAGFGVITQVVVPPLFAVLVDLGDTDVAIVGGTSRATTTSPVSNIDLGDPGLSEIRS